MNALTWLFLAALALATATRLWLAVRQIRYVSAHADAVPDTFVDAIPIAAHRKAADYTAAKARLGMLDIAIDAVLVLALTVGGLLQGLSDAWALVFARGSLW